MLTLASIRGRRGVVSGAAVLLAEPAAWPVPPRLPCHAVCSGGFVEARRGDGCEGGGRGIEFASAGSEKPLPMRQ